MNLQGKLDCKYHVGFYWNAKAPRLALKDAWPTNPEENLERLKDAGVPVERGIPKCSNCDGKDINNMLRFMGFPNTAVELGHISKSCTQDKAEKEAHNVKCVNCDKVGHRARDCKTARKDRFACRNCG